MVSGDDGLDVGGEPAAAGQEVEIVAHAAVDQIAVIGPVPEIPGASIDLVNDDAARLAGVIRRVQVAGSTGHRGNVG